MNRELNFEEDVIDRLARIEERLEPLKDHETRIRGIERKQWLFAGAAAAVGAVLGKFGFHLPFPIG